jgi:hypothetical protein
MTDFNKRVAQLCATSVRRAFVTHVVRWHFTSYRHERHCPDSEASHDRWTGFSRVPVFSSIHFLVFCGFIVRLLWLLRLVELDGIIDVAEDSADTVFILCVQSEE